MADIDRKREIVKAIREKRARIQSVKLARAEIEQADRIVAERLKPCSSDKHEAIEVVVADRKQREMVCHGGPVETL